MSATIDPNLTHKKTRQEKINDYDAFVEKFKPKLTTDDCYTPPAIYEVIRNWVSENILPLEGVPVVRPFWPGADFENFDYPEGCVVIDNPPFSLMAKIRRFYHERNIRYFLFAPTLTMVNTAKELNATYIVAGAYVAYHNGAKVPTSFITNLDCDGLEIWVAGDLTKRIEQANKREQQETSKTQQPKYEYPLNIVSPATLRKIAQRGITLKVHQDHCKKITSIDSQKEKRKTIFGRGWILSERAAAERAAAERAAAERAAARETTYWPLSERERGIIAELG